MRHVLYWGIDMYNEMLSVLVMLIGAFMTGALIIKATTEDGFEYWYCALVGLLLYLVSILVLVSIHLWVLNCLGMLI